MRNLSFYAASRLTPAAAAFLIIGLILAALLTVYAVQARRARGKPQPERRGTLGLSDGAFSG